MLLFHYTRGVPSRGVCFEDAYYTTHGFHGQADILGHVPSFEHTTTTLTRYDFRAFDNIHLLYNQYIGVWK
jgi:hypothetical protein